mmetsp:Transcript_24684/g.79706  ORF Transcript_24684/g.79706 Transcript_24684/m.79706 type:complete len:237 (+) Transcript_24684:1833-2543(+)
MRRRIQRREEPGRHRRVVGGREGPHAAGGAAERGGGVPGPCEDRLSLRPFRRLEEADGRAQHDGSEGHRVRSAAYAQRQGEQVAQHGAGRGLEHVVQRRTRARQQKQRPAQQVERDGGGSQPHPVRAHRSERALRFAVECRARAAAQDDGQVHPQQAKDKAEALCARQAPAKGVGAQVGVRVVQAKARAQGVERAGTGHGAAEHAACEHQRPRRRPAEHRVRRSQEAVSLAAVRHD